MNQTLLFLFNNNCYKKTWLRKTLFKHFTIKPLWWTRFCFNHLFNHLWVTNIVFYEWNYHMKHGWWHKLLWNRTNNTFNVTKVTELWNYEHHEYNQLEIVSTVCMTRHNVQTSSNLLRFKFSNVTVQVGRRHG